MASVWSFVDICPHHKAPSLASLCDWHCLPRKSPVLEQPGLQVHWHVVGSVCRPCLPLPGDARQHRPIPEISWPLGLSLQLKLKYESSQASSLCVSERKTVPECVMETVGGLFSGSCAYVGELSLQVLSCWGAAQGT